MAPLQREESFTNMGPSSSFCRFYYQPLQQTIKVALGEKIPSFVHPPPSFTSNNVEEENVDAFRYYSNDVDRMRKLKLLNTTSSSADEEKSQSAWCDQEEKKKPAQQRERKTRISFELHPDLVLEDVLDEDAMWDSDDDGNEDLCLDRIFPSDANGVVSSTGMTRRDLLRSLLQ